MKYRFLTTTPNCFIIGFILIALFVGSCKKEDDDAVNDYEISFKANGDLEEFKVEDVAGSFYEDETGSQFGLRFTASKGDFTFYVEVYDRQVITNSTYSGYKTTPAVGQKPIIVEGASLAYNDGGTYTVHKTDFKDPDVSISISEISKTFVRGSFKGTLKAKGKPDMIITEGKFFVPVVNPY